MYITCKVLLLLTCISHVKFQNKTPLIIIITFIHDLTQHIGIVSIHKF